MPRLPRYVIPDQPQHFILRDNNGAETFCNDDDYRFYQEKLNQAWCIILIGVANMPVMKTEVTWGS
jgi:REP element-mobilizing transposase RayT